MSWTKWTRGPLAALAVCVLLPWGAAACTTGEAHGGTVSPSPVGKVLDDTDETGRHLREVPGKNAPEVGVEVTPDPAGGWDVRLTLRRFRWSAPGAEPAAVTGRGLAHLFVDGRRVARLRTATHHLAAGLPHGTHQVTARLYADDGTVWAVHGKPVQSTADITVSGAETGAGADTGAGARTGAGVDAGTGAGVETGAGADAAGGRAGAGYAVGE
ncbi:hypothetical protein [Streptomyces sp. NPDC013455]|uniref:hypothetical protein n=1 Tax=Streptomyces sp. NPDC013455 TaxID=3155605 RepID=UPI0033DF1F7D